ncbi:MAG: hypothetical protein AB8B71_14275 [Paracoccaceae bacterium]
MGPVFTTLTALSIASLSFSGPQDPLILAQSTTQGIATFKLGATDTDGLQAEDQTPTGRFTTATEVKPILGATRANWVAVREYGGQDLVYVTHLWAWRCGLAQMKLSINGTAPEIWPLPACHLDTAQPAAILESDGLPYRSFALGSVQTITVTLIYDDLTRDVATFDRAGTLLP